MDDEPVDPERLVLLMNCLLDVFRVLNATPREAIAAMATVAGAMGAFAEKEPAEEGEPQWRH